MRPLKKGGGPAMGRLKHFLPVMLVAICASISVAQEALRSTQLHLHVVDESGAAIAGARIEFVQSGGHGVAGSSASTDGRGEWDQRLPAAEYVIRVQKEGFEPAEYRVAVAAGTMELRLTLRVAQHVETVEARTEGYLADQETTAARVPLQLAETPQQIEVLTGELLQARATQSMKQAMEMVPAAGLQLGEGRRDNFYIRGFNAVGDVYVDGVRDTAQYYRDLSNTERIEVLEGPAAVLYGRGSSGGLINRVTKRPQMEGALGELSYTAGTYGE